MQENKIKKRMYEENKEIKNALDYFINSFDGYPQLFHLLLSPIHWYTNNITNLLTDAIQDKNNFTPLKVAIEIRRALIDVIDDIDAVLAIGVNNEKG